MVLAQCTQAPPRVHAEESAARPPAEEALPQLTFDAMEDAQGDLDDDLLVAACEAVEARMAAAAATNSEPIVAMETPVLEAPGQQPVLDLPGPQEALPRPRLPPPCGGVFPRPPNWVLEALSRADGLTAVLAQIQPQVAVQALQLPGSTWEVLFKCLVLLPHTWEDPTGALQEMVLHARWTLACADMPRRGPGGLGRIVEQEALPQCDRVTGGTTPP